MTHLIRKMTNQVLRAGIIDAAEILELQQLAYQSEAAIYSDWSLPPLTQTLNEIEREFRENIFLKVCDAGKIIGSVRAADHHGTCRIGRLIVHPDFRRKGTGTQLMAAIEAQFPTVARFELFTGSRSTGNIRLYERLGYHIFRTARLSPLVALVFMEKRRALMPRLPE